MLVRRPSDSCPPSLHDALPIWRIVRRRGASGDVEEPVARRLDLAGDGVEGLSGLAEPDAGPPGQVRRGGRAVAREVDRKSTRLNSSHGYISYAVLCLKKKRPDQ